MPPPFYEPLNDSYNSKVHAQLMFSVTFTDQYLEIHSLSILLCLYCSQFLCLFGFFFKLNSLFSRQTSLCYACTNGTLCYPRYLSYIYLHIHVVCMHWFKLKWRASRMEGVDRQIVCPEEKWGSEALIINYWFDKSPPTPSRFECSLPLPLTHALSVHRTRPLEEQLHVLQPSTAGKLWPTL